MLEQFFNAENLTSQVDVFLEDDLDLIPEETLYVMWIGSNDAADALGAFLLGNTEAGGAIIEAAVANTAQQMFRLYQAGARRFLIVNVPDLAVTPRVRDLAAAHCAASVAPDICQQQILIQVSVVSGAYNGGLQYTLLGLLQLPDVSIQLLDVSAFLHQVVDNPASFGFENAEQSCVVPDTYQQAFCEKAADYLFWDGQHPTNAGHKALAAYALQQLGIE
jgi:outer membrane lipase/esterase